MSFWAALNEQERAALRSAARPRTYAAREPLANQGDDSTHVLLITDGWAKVTNTTEDGHEIVLAVRGPGDLVGEGGFLGQPRSATITALSAVRAQVIPADRFTAFLDAHPRLWREISRMFIERLDTADRRLGRNVSSNGMQRLALLLAGLAELSAPHQPPRPEHGIDIAPPLSQEELSSWVDASRETVSRAIGAFRRHGLISTGWRRITVMDPAGLRAFAQDHRLPDPDQAGPAGGTDPRRDRPRLEHLTAAESAVADLAADGLTNRQIATELRITASTVEQHLGRVYRKLNVRGRAQLVGALGSSAPQESDRDTAGRPPT